MRLMTECPCCHGKKKIEVVRLDLTVPFVDLFPCSHCDEQGVVETEERYQHSNPTNAHRLA